MWAISAFSSAPHEPDLAAGPLLFILSVLKTRSLDYRLTQESPRSESPIRMRQRGMLTLTVGWREQCECK